MRHSKPGTILDVGAGTGLFLECAVRWGLSAIRIEGWADAIEIARTRNPKVSLIQLYLNESFPYCDETFQTAIMNQTIEHLERNVAELCLQEVYRVLVPGGMLFVASPCKFNRSEKNADPTHISMYSPKELEDLLSAKSFVGIDSMNKPSAFFG